MEENLKKQAKTEKALYEKERRKGISLYAERIETRRKEKGISQKELANMCDNISESSLSNYVSGKSIPSALALKEIAIALDVSADYLLGLSEEPTLDAEMQAICKKTGLSEKTVNELILYAEHKRNNSDHFSKYTGVIDNTFQLINEGDNKSILCDLIRFEEISDEILQEKQKVCDTASEIHLTLYGTYNGLDDIINSKRYRDLIDKKSVALFNIQRKFVNKLEDQFEGRSNKINLKFSKKISDYNSIK